MNVSGNLPSLPRTFPATPGAPPGGSITLTLKRLAGFAVARISDTGCGMDEETQKHIFDKFYQGDSSHSQEGNGLGLALAKKAIDITGAKISVMSKPGEGTTFAVRLKMAGGG
jgi:signal transduction histidine kinase